MALRALIFIRYLKQYCFYRILGLLLHKQQRIYMQTQQGLIDFLKILPLQDLQNRLSMNFANKKVVEIGQELLAGKCSMLTT